MTEFCIPHLHCLDGGSGELLTVITVMDFGLWKGTHLVILYLTVSTPKRKVTVIVSLREDSLNYLIIKGGWFSLVYSTLVLLEQR